MDTLQNEILSLLMKRIESSERMKELYEIRLSLVRENFKEKNEYEKNEVEILEMKTQGQIDILTETIHERKEEFCESYYRYIEELEFEDKTDDQW